MEGWASTLPSHLKKLSQKAFQPTVQLIDESSLKFLKEVHLSTDSNIYDINYSNLTNKQIRDLALVSESNIYNGIGMLVEQAAASFFLWFGKRPNTKIVKDILNERL